MNISTDFKAEGVIVIESHEAVLEARTATVFRDSVRSQTQHRNRVVPDMFNTILVDRCGVAR